jgi:hypothetical protein
MRGGEVFVNRWKKISEEIFHFRISTILIILKKKKEPRREGALRYNGKVF